MSTNPRRLGKYELQECLGRGGMAEVWKAFDPQLKRFVAIKLLRADLQADPSFVARFEREAQVIASLQHPNIVQIYDFNVSQPPESETIALYMVMRCVEGQTLAGFIRNTSRIGKIPSPATIVNLFIPIALAIDYAHQKGMIHRDIKPSNILLDEHNTSHNPMGEPVLSDFGLAKLLGGSPATLSRWWLGTPHYTSPEQAMGVPGNERSDIYSLGVILYEICTGMLPFQGMTPTEIMMQHVNSAPPAPMLINPAIPPALTGVILRALAKDPAARFPTASAMVAALAEAFNMPIPKVLNVPGSSSEPMDSLTQLSPLSPRLLSGGQSSSGVLPVAPLSKPLPSLSIRPAQPANAADSERSIPGVFMGNTPHVTPLPPPSVPLPAIASLQPSPGTIPPGSPFPPLTPRPAARLSPSTAGKRRRWLFIGLLVAVILVVLSSGLAAFFLLNKPSGQLIAQPIVGHAFFISSGQIGETSNQGIMDELQVELANVPNPAAGKSYYGWLEQEQTFTQTPTVAPLLLGKLPVTNGSISFHYTDPQHSNLLATRSIFLITEEDTAAQPIAPIDHSTWRYGAQLLSLPFRLGMRLPGTPPPTLRPGTRFITSMTRLRYLLAQAPPLQPDQPGQPGGLDIWLFRNAEKILEWSVSARDDWQTGSFLSLHRHLVRILDYLDGLPFVQQDAAGEPVYVTAANAQVGLLNVNPSGDSSGDPTKLGFLYMIDDHLNALIQSTASTPYQRGLATQIDQTVKQVRAWLTNVRKDAQQLERMSSAQLAQTSTRDSLLDAMSNDALAAFAGQIDPATGNVEKGVIQIHYDIQRLATFDLHAASGPCSVDDLFYSQCRPTP